MEDEPLDDDSPTKDTRITREVMRDDLRDKILSGTIPAGQLLPSERTLVEEYGSSRGSVREAIRALEVEGLIEVNRGRFGGSRVVVPRRDRLVHLVDIFVRANGVSLSAMLDCRSAIEPMMARLATRSITDEDLRDLEALHEKFVNSVDDIKTYRAVNYEWHLRIARISGNEPLLALIEPILSIASSSLEYEQVTTPENRQRAIVAHSEVMSALRARDEQHAALAMEAHLTSYSRLTRELEKDI